MSQRFEILKTGQKQRAACIEADSPLVTNKYLLSSLVEHLLYSVLSNRDYIIKILLA